MSELTEKLVRYVRSIPFADNEAGHPEIAQAMREAAAEITRLETELAEVKDTIRAFEEVHIPLLKHEIDILKGEHQTWSSGGTDEAAEEINSVVRPYNFTDNEKNQIAAIILRRFPDQTERTYIADANGTGPGSAAEPVPDEPDAAEA